MKEVKFWEVYNIILCIFYTLINRLVHLRTIEAHFWEKIRTTEAHFDFTGPVTHDYPLFPFSGAIFASARSSPAVRGYAAAARPIQRAARILSLTAVGSLIFSNDEVAAGETRRYYHHRQLCGGQKPPAQLLEGEGEAG